MYKLKVFYADWFPPKPVLTEKEYPKLAGKVYIVTGSTTGIGLEAAKLLAGTGATVYVHGRTKENIDKAIATIQKDVPEAHLKSLNFDLSDLPTIKPGLQPFLDSQEKLDGIVLNAGVMTPPKGSVSKQGYELHLGTNNIGHHLVVRLLEGTLANPSRIVWTTSAGHGMMAPPSGVSWDTEANKPINIDSLSRTELYGQSKSINIFQSYQWTQHHPGSHTLSLSVHPGLLNTDLGRHFPAFSRWLVSKVAYPAKYGAYSELFGLLYPDTEVFAKEFGNGPIYISPFGVARKDLLREDVAKSASDEVGRRIWQYLEEQTDKYI